MDEEDKGMSEYIRREDAEKVLADTILEERRQAEGIEPEIFECQPSYPFYEMAIQRLAKELLKNVATINVND